MRGDATACHFWGGRDRGSTRARDAARAAWRAATPPRAPPRARVKRMGGFRSFFAPRDVVQQQRTKERHDARALHGLDVLRSRRELGDRLHERDAIFLVLLEDLQDRARGRHRTRVQEEVRKRGARGRVVGARVDAARGDCVRGARARSGGREMFGTKALVAREETDLVWGTAFYTV